MNRIISAATLMLMVYCLCTFPSSGQEKKDSTKTFKNTIRVNLTNPMLFGENYNVIGYERVTSKHQSFSINIGRFSLPKFVSVNTDSIKVLKSNNHDKGFTLAADYRFYLKKENKYNAPRGIYLGPYYSFNLLQRNITWDMSAAGVTGNVSADLRLNANLIGGQMGYQFVLWNRLSIDMILVGPGVWFYSVNTKLNTTLSEDDETMIFEKINSFLEEKLPGRDIFIQPGSWQTSGTYTTKSGGWRYMFQIGFRF